MHYKLFAINVLKDELGGLNRCSHANQKFVRKITLNEIHPCKVASYIAN